MEEEGIGGLKYQMMMDSMNDTSTDNPSQSFNVVSVLTIKILIGPPKQEDFSAITEGEQGFRGRLGSCRDGSRH